MTQQLFHEWIHSFFIPEVKNQLKQKELPQKAILLLDNASVHYFSGKDEIEGIKLIFLPPNATALIQPLDQSIIFSFKQNYRKTLLREIVIYSKPENSTIIERLKKFNLKDCLILIKNAWNSISESTIVNSWTKARLITQSIINEDQVHQTEDTYDEFCIDSDSFEEILSLENKEDCCLFLSDHQIIQITTKEISQEIDLVKPESETESVSASESEDDQMKK
jgi:hypothetical protein